MTSLAACQLHIEALAREEKGKSGASSLFKPKEVLPPNFVKVRCPWRVV